MSVWKILRLEPTNDVKAIKQAYAALLKQTRPEDDAEGYQALRAAFDEAMRQSRSGLLDQDDTPDTRELVIDAEPAAGRPDRLPAADVESQADDAVEDLVARLETEGEAAALDRLQEIVTSDDFLYVDFRQLLETKLLHMGLRTYDRPRFPTGLFERISQIYDWRNTHADELDGSLRGPIAARLAAHERYQDLVRLARSRFTLTSTFTPFEPRAARVLLGEYRPAYFEWLLFSRTLFLIISNKLKDLEKSVPQIFDYYLDTPTVRWFREHRHGHHLSRDHVLIGYGPAAFLFDQLVPFVSTSSLYVLTAILVTGALIILTACTLAVRAIELAAYRAKPYWHRFSTYRFDRPLYFQTCFALSLVSYVAGALMDHPTAWLLLGAAIATSAHIWGDMFWRVGLVAVGSIPIFYAVQHMVADSVLPDFFSTPFHAAVVLSMLSFNLVRSAQTYAPQSWLSRYSNLVGLISPLMINMLAFTFLVLVLAHFF